jgi:hypothetical protein
MLVPFRRLVIILYRPRPVFVLLISVIEKSQSKTDSRGHKKVHLFVIGGIDPLMNELILHESSNVRVDLYLTIIFVWLARTVNFIPLLLYWGRNINFSCALKIETVKNKTGDEDDTNHDSNRCTCAERSLIVGGGL